MHEENQAVVLVPCTVLSTSKPIMTELLQLQVIMRLPAVSSQVKRIPYTVNRFTDVSSWIHSVWRCASKRAVVVVNASFETEPDLFH